MILKIAAAAAFALCAYVAGLEYTLHRFRETVPKGSYITTQACFESVASARDPKNTWWDDFLKRQFPWYGIRENPRISDDKLKADLRRLLDRSLK